MRFFAIGAASLALVGCGDPTPGTVKCRLAGNQEIVVRAADVVQDGEVLKVYLTGNRNYTAFHPSTEFIQVRPGTRCRVE